MKLLHEHGWSGMVMVGSWPLVLVVKQPIDQAGACDTINDENWFAVTRSVSGGWWMCCSGTIPVSAVLLCDASVWRPMMCNNNSFKFSPIVLQHRKRCSDSTSSKSLTMKYRIYTLCSGLYNLGSPVAQSIAYENSKLAADCPMNHLL